MGFIIQVRRGHVCEVEERAEARRLQQRHQQTLDPNNGNIIR